MTQSEFIEKVNQIAGITFRNATLSSWENGQSSPTSDLLPVISQILQTPVVDLFTPEASKTDSPTIAEEPTLPYTPGLNIDLYKKIFQENPVEGFEQLLRQYDSLLQTCEQLKAENQRLEGKLAASSEFLKQLMDLKK